MHLIALTYIYHYGVVIFIADTQLQKNPTAYNKILMKLVSLFIRHIRYVQTALLS